MPVHLVYKPYAIAVCHRSGRDMVVFDSEKDIKKIAEFLPKDCLCKHCLKSMDYFLSPIWHPNKPINLSRYFKTRSELLSKTP